MHYNTAYLSIVLRIPSEINNNRALVGIYGEVDNHRSWLGSANMAPENPTSSYKPASAHGKEISEIGLGKPGIGPRIEPQESIQSGLRSPGWLLERLDGGQWHWVKIVRLKLEYVNSIPLTIANQPSDGQVLYELFTA